MNKKRIRPQSIILLLTPILLAVIVFLIGRYPSERIGWMLFGAVYWVFGILGIVEMVKPIVGFFKGRKDRRAALQSKTCCYKLVCTTNDRVSAYMQLIPLELMMLSAVLYIFLSHPTAKMLSFLVYMIPVLIGVILMIVAFIPIEIVNLLTAHACLDDEGISVESEAYQQFPWVIRWEQLTSVDVQHDPKCKSGIRRVTLQGRTEIRRLRPIVIPGSHPDIQRILQNIREHAPNLMNEAL